jgi:hypothetical protein
MPGLSTVPVYVVLYPCEGFHTFGGRRIQDIAFVKVESHSNAWDVANRLPRPAEATLVGWRRRDDA